MRHLDYSPSVAFPALAMTRTLDTDLSADLMLDTTQHEGGKQVLEHLMVLAEWEYKQPVKDERKDVHIHGKGREIT